MQSAILVKISDCTYNVVDTYWLCSLMVEISEGTPRYLEFLVEPNFMDHKSDKIWTRNRKKVVSVLSPINFRLLIPLKMATSGPDNSREIALSIFLILTVAVGARFPVPRSDVLFAICFSLYLFFMNHVRFENNIIAIRKGLLHTSLGRGKFLKTPGFRVYMKIFAILGVFIPLIIMVSAPLNVTQSAAPHLFLLLAQISMEQITNRPWFHDLPRILVPIGFSIWREGALYTWTWMAYEQFYYRDPWSVFNLCLSCVNSVIWSYNLFFFLMMRMTPCYLHPEESPYPDVKWICYVWPVIQRDATESKVD